MKLLPIPLDSLKKQKQTNIDRLYIHILVTHINVQFWPFKYHYYLDLQVRGVLSSCSRLSSVSGTPP